MSAAPAAGSERPPLTVQAVGNEIKRLRKLRGMTLEQLAFGSGVSAGLLSQVERGQGNPSFNTLVQVAHALGIPVARLMVGEQLSSPVVRRSERRRLNLGTEDELVVMELLTSRLDSALEAIRIVAEPGYSTEETPFVHDGEEFGIVLEGSHAVNVGGAHYVMEAGDSISYSSTIPHWYENPGDVTSVSLWVVTPPSF
ncbi:MAG: cupin domain-containing protein [Acidimicrobiia bacterium]|nr:cupin domain-containing protein [Acidimicrobiia bacterium]MYB24530.1 cupin domain-containing protein [Acidimicrobiia bacterium]MYJ14190.1 cupin domain-containing protein [Acidimicrobiia bacterium]